MKQLCDFIYIKQSFYILNNALIVPLFKKKCVVDIRQVATEKLHIVKPPRWNCYAKQSPFFQISVSPEELKHGQRSIHSSQPFIPSPWALFQLRLMYVNQKTAKNMRP